MTITELRTKRVSVWESAKAFLNSHRQENELLSAEYDATYSKMEKKITDLVAEIARLERQEDIEDELNKPVNQPLIGQPMKTGDQEPQRLIATKACREDFLNHIRGRNLLHNVLAATLTYGDQNDKDNNIYYRILQTALYTSKGELNCNFLFMNGHDFSIITS